jgi:cytochrome P450
VRKGLKAIRVFKKAMRALVKEVKARGPVSSHDVSVCGHLMRLRDPRTGEPLDEDLLVGEFSLFFSAGIESAGNALTWTTCAPHGPT